MRKVKLRNNVREELAKQMRLKSYENGLRPPADRSVIAAATLVVLLPIVDSLNNGTTRQSVLAERRQCRPRSCGVLR